jgi:DNA-binding NarL/FixJ family response regulator
MTGTTGATLAREDTGRGDWLTAREREVLALVASGATTVGIARHLAITDHTVESHIRSARTKLGVPTRTAAAAHAAPVPVGSVAPTARPIAVGPTAAALLAALARGCFVADAAREANVSLRTAHRRLSTARRQLGAATTAEAVARWGGTGGW